MTKHSSNLNLTLHESDNYRGLLVYTAKGPLIQEYLERLYQVIQDSLEEHPRTLALRIDLRFPTNRLPNETYSNSAINSFFASFKAKIKHNRRMATQASEHAHETSVRYGWAREFGEEGRPHYHLLILLNNDAFHRLGSFEMGRDNLYNRLVQAWASALGMTPEAAQGLVQIPENPTYVLRRGDSTGLADCFYRASYLCKATTKVYGDGSHSFGASRI